MISTEGEWLGEYAYESETKGEMTIPIKTAAEVIECIAELVHKAYCREYERQNDEEYWTGGDYSLLDEDIKEFDRVTVHVVLEYIRGDKQC